jgi:glycosyltransferase involved in cell wall biosynthesis
MKLLILSSNPNRASFRQRIGVYLGFLSEKGINCEVSILPHSLLARRRLFKRAKYFDAVFLHKKGLNPFDAFCLKKYSKRIIYNFDDAIMYSDKNPQLTSLSHFIPFRRSVKIADMVIVGSSYLADHARRFNHNVKIQPIGLKFDEYQVGQIQKKDNKIRLVWIGSGSTLSYLEQIKDVLEDIGLRFNHVVLRIIGDKFFDLQNMKVEKRQWSKETRVFDLATSDIGLAPLPDNRFTKGKCSFKVLEYSSVGLPVVASPVGTNPHHIQENITGFLVTSKQQWKDKISRLIENENLRNQMGDSGRIQAKKFDISVIGNELCSLITECIRGSTDDVKEAEQFRNGPEIVTTSQEPKVSICIPTYNRKNYLKETLKSILAQTYKDYEIVIVDDGSTDGTKDMIKKLPIPVTYHWQPNAGEPAARNKLLELAKGEFINFIDSDDLLFPYAIEQLLETLYKHGPDVIVYGTYIRIDEKGNQLKRKKVRLPSGNITAELFDRIYVNSCGTMCKKKILQQAGGFDASLYVCSPYVLWLRLSLKYRFVSVEKPVFKRRRHYGNLSERKYVNMKTEFHVLEKFYYNDGGKNVISQQQAMKRLSREGYRAARCAIREGLYNQASQLLGQSFRRHPNLKSLIYWTKAGIAKRVASS